MPKNAFFQNFLKQSNPLCVMFTLHFSNEFLLKLHILVAQVPMYKNCWFRGYFFNQIVDCLIKNNQWVTTEKSISITQNGYILRECAILGFVEQSLLYKTLYLVSHILLNNFHKSGRNIICCILHHKMRAYLRDANPFYSNATSGFWWSC